MSDTDHIQAIRRQSVRRLVDEHGGLVALARRLGLTRGSYVSQLLSDPPFRPITEKTARVWEKKLGLPAGWMDGGAQIPKGVDTRLLEGVILGVNQALTEAGIKLTPAKLSEFITLMYADALVAGAIPTARIQSTIKLLM